MTTEPTTVTDEIAAMRRIVATLDRLDPTTRERVVRWLGERYQHITSAIAAAIDERNFDVIPGLLAALALVDPAAAQRTLDALLGKLTVDLGATP